MSLIERIGVPCFFDPQLDCDKECKLFHANLKTIDELCSKEGVPDFVIAIGIRESFLSLNPESAEAILERRIRSIEENDGSRNDCYNFS